jgi:hypothetical protein
MWSYPEGSSGLQNMEGREREHGSGESNYSQPSDGVKSMAKREVALDGCSNFKTGAL